MPVRSPQPPAMSWTAVQQQQYTLVQLSGSSFLIAVHSVSRISRDFRSSSATDSLLLSSSSRRWLSCRADLRILCSCFSLSLTASLVLSFFLLSSSRHSLCTICRRGSGRQAVPASPSAGDRGERERDGARGEARRVAECGGSIKDLTMKSGCSLEEKGHTSRSQNHRKKKASSENISRENAVSLSLFHLLSTTTHPLRCCFGTCCAAAAVAVALAFIFTPDSSLRIP